VFGTDRQGRSSQISSRLWRRDPSLRSVICKLNTDDVSCANAAFCDFFCDLCIRAHTGLVTGPKYNKITLSSVQEEGKVAVGYLNWPHSLLLKT
jgi:hypothetical protein